MRGIAQYAALEEANATVNGRGQIWANNGFTQWAQRTAFRRLAITPPKVNRFGLNLEYCKPNVWGWPWQILGTIRSVASDDLTGSQNFFVR